MKTPLRRLSCYLRYDKGLSTSSEPGDVPVSLPQRVSGDGKLVFDGPMSRVNVHNAFTIQPVSASDRLLNDSWYYAAQTRGVVL